SSARRRRVMSLWVSTTIASACSVAASGADPASIGPARNDERLKATIDAATRMRVFVPSAGDEDQTVGQPRADRPTQRGIEPSCRFQDFAPSPPRIAKAAY